MQILIAPIAIARQASSQNLFQQFRQCGIELTNGDWVFRYYSCDDLGRRVLCKWRLAGQQIVQGRAQRINVCAEVQLVALDLLG